MPILYQGCIGDEVARLQALLCLAEIDSRPIDGNFGPATERAVRACQMRRDLPATGQADLRTQELIGMNRPDTTKIFVPVIDRVTPDIVAQMFSRLVPRSNIEAYLPPVLAALLQSGLDDREIVLMALATIRAETARFEPLSERLSRYNTDPGAHPFNRYDNRIDLGNRGRPDGESFKGRGFVQITGRANYQHYGERLGLHLVEEPELANQPEVAANILAAFIADKRDHAKYAILGNDLKTTRRLVNGGSHGLWRFTQAFETGLRLLA